VGESPLFYFFGAWQLSVLANEELLRRLTALCEQAVAHTGIEVVDVEIRGSGSARLLRVYIDKPSGVSHGDCELVSERFGGLLDESNVMPEDSYTLEVSSPGVERPLKKPRDFERVVGQTIKLSLKQPVENQRRLEGKLAGIEGSVLEVETAPGMSLRVDLAQIQKANLKFQW
jgi:ribosome maturation factor RimP